MNKMVIEYNKCFSVDICLFNTVTIGKLVSRNLNECTILERLLDEMCKMCKELYNKTSRMFHASHVTAKDYSKEIEHVLVVKIINLVIFTRGYQENCQVPKCLFYS